MIRVRFVTTLGFAAFAGALFLGACTSSSTSTSTTARPATSSSPSTSAAPGTTSGGTGACTATPVKGDTTLNAKVGETVSVALETNAGTGYSWKAAAPTGTSVTPAGSNAVPCGNSPGSPTLEVFSYKAASPGSSTVVFTSVPPGGGAPGKTVNVTMVIS